MGDHEDERPELCRVTAEGGDGPDECQEALARQVFDITCALYAEVVSHDQGEQPVQILERRTAPLCADASIGEKATSVDSGSRRGLTLLIDAFLSPDADWPKRRTGSAPRVNRPRPACARRTLGRRSLMSLSAGDRSRCLRRKPSPRSPCVSSGRCRGPFRCRRRPSLHCRCRCRCFFPCAGQNRARCFLGARRSSTLLTEAAPSPMVSVRKVTSAGTKRGVAGARRGICHPRPIRFLHHLNFVHSCSKYIKPNSINKHLLFTPFSSCQKDVSTYQFLALLAQDPPVCHEVLEFHRVIVRQIQNQAFP